ncbi:uncharacterized protein ISCGN_009778 [Ixodes scapularis]
MGDDQPPTFATWVFQPGGASGALGLKRAYHGHVGPDSQLLIAQAALACPLSRQHDPADRSVTVPLSSLKTTQGHVSGITFLADNEDDGRNKRLVFDESTRSASTSTVAYEATKGLSERFAIRGQGSTHVCTMSNPLIFFTQLLIAQAALACPLSRQHDPADRSVTVPLSSLKTTQGHVSGITFLADNEDDGRNKRLVFDESTRSASTSTVAYEATKGLSERFAIRGQGSTHVCTMSNPLIFFTQANVTYGNTSSHALCYTSTYIEIMSAMLLLSLSVSPLVCGWTGCRSVNWFAARSMTAPYSQRKSIPRITALEQTVLQKDELHRARLTVDLDASSASPDWCDEVPSGGSYLRSIPRRRDFSKAAGEPPTQD